MEAANILPIAGLLALAVVVVIVLLRLMRRRRGAHDRRLDDTPVEAPPPAAPRSPRLTEEEQEYLDSSHITGPVVPGGRDALETWQSNKRK